MWVDYSAGQNTGESSEMDAGSDGSAGVEHDTAEPRPEEALARHLGAPPDAARLAAALGSSQRAREVLRDMSALLGSVEAQEHHELARLVHSLAQYLMLLQARPTKDNGERLLGYLREVRRNVELRASWPRGPLDDPRTGTILEGADTLIFEHASEGLIRLQWNNPFPKPEWLSGGGFQCDMCYKQELLMGYQHVTEDNARDNSQFIPHRVGFDVCASCAVLYVEQHRGALCAWLGDVARGCHRRLHRPCASLLYPELSLSVRSFALTPDGSVTLEADVSGTAGLHATVAVLPASAEVHGELPAAWLRTGTAVLDAPGSPASASSSSPVLVPAPAPSEVEFTCATGDSWRVQAGSKRGVLQCYGRAAPLSLYADWGPEPCRAICFGEREPRTPEEAKAPFLTFQGVGRTAWLRTEGSDSTLADLHQLASRAGVVHNIPVRPSWLLERSRSRSRSGSSSGDWLLPPAALGGYGAASDASTSSGTSALPSWPQGLAPSKKTVETLYFSADWSEIGECCICLDGLGDSNWLRGSPLRTLCGHVFHGACLRKHTRGHSGSRGQRCPNCRAKNPLRGVQHIRSNGSLRVNLSCTSSGDALEIGRCYRIVAILCQDPQAAFDSAMVLSCAVMQPGDPLPYSASDAAPEVGRFGLPR